MTDELKSLIEDAAKLLGYKHVADNIYDAGDFVRVFDPTDPERGDLMKVAMAAKLTLELDLVHKVSHWSNWKKEQFDFVEGDFDSLAYAILRAASEVWKARGGE